MNVLDSGIARRYTPARKALSYGLRIPRAIIKVQAKPIEYRQRPPIIVNSIPKSGTHLLMQIARAMPERRYFGSFIAQQPSLTLRNRPDDEIAMLLDRMVPGEVVGAHLHYSGQAAKKISEMSAIHLMIIRNPRDVFDSEIHYLRTMNRYHKMAHEFRGICDEDACKLALHGSKQTREFPKFSERLKPYLGWLHSENCYIVRFEDFHDPEKRRATLSKIVNLYVQRTGCFEAKATLLKKAEQAINPSKSHTVSSRDRAQNSKVATIDELVFDRLREALGY